MVCFYLQTCNFVLYCSRDKWSQVICRMYFRKLLILDQLKKIIGYIFLSVLEAALLPGWSGLILVQERNTHPLLGTPNGHAVMSCSDVPPWKAVLWGCHNNISQSLSDTTTLLQELWGSINQNTITIHFECFAG